MAVWQVKEPRVFEHFEDPHFPSLHSSISRHLLLWIQLIYHFKLDREDATRTFDFLEIRYYRHMWSCQQYLCILNSTHIFQENTRLYLHIFHQFFFRNPVDRYNCNCQDNFDNFDSARNHEDQARIRLCLHTKSHYHQSLHRKFMKVIDSQKSPSKQLQENDPSVLEHVELFEQALTTPHSSISTHLSPLNS